MNLRPCTLAWPGPKSNLDPSPSFPLVTMKSNLQLLTSQRASLTSGTQSPHPPSSARAGLGDRHSYLEPQPPRRAVNFRHREQQGMVRRPWQGQERRTLWAQSQRESTETQGMGTASPIQGHTHELREGRDTPSSISITDDHWYSLVNPRGLSVDIRLIHSARETRPQTKSCQQNHTPTITDKAPVLNHSHPMLYEISKLQNSVQTSNMPTWALTRHLPLETISLLLVT